MTLGTVFRTALLTVTDTRGIQRTAHGVITHTWQVLNTTTANQNDTVLLQVMPFTTDVRRHLKPVGQTHTTNLTQRRVGLFRGSGINEGTDTALLRDRSDEHTSDHQTRVYTV